MKEIKVYTHEEMLNRVIGEKGSPAREKYETNINFLLVKLLNKQEKLKTLLRNN